jgi:hypothetical protein
VAYEEKKPALEVSEACEARNVTQRGRTTYGIDGSSYSRPFSLAWNGSSLELSIGWYR